MIDLYNLQARSSWNPEHALSADDPYISSMLTFETKEQYVAWRAEWKTQYREMSKRIRDLRVAWRAQGSNHDTVTHNALFSSRALARSMLALRRASKVRAEALYQASLQPVA